MYNHVFVKGFAMKTIFKFQQFSIIAYNLHLTSMSAQQFNIIAASLLNDIQEAKLGGPNSLVVAGGDLDFRFPGDETFRIDG